MDALNALSPRHGRADHESGRSVSIYAMEEFNYNCKKWKMKAAHIMRRDKYICQNCKRYGVTRAAEQVHHIKHVDEYPELAYEDDNLIALCNKCHQKQHPEKAKRLNRRYGWKI